MADDMPKIEFCEFQEYEPQNNASPAKINTRRSDTEVGMVAGYYLVGLCGHIMCWIGELAQSRWRFITGSK